MLQIPALDAISAVLESILFHSLQQGVKQVAPLPRVFLLSEWCLNWCLSRARIAVPARAGIFQREGRKTFRGREIAKALVPGGHG